jgi:hypothetical protein
MNNKYNKLSAILLIATVVIFIPFMMWLRPFNGSNFLLIALGVTFLLLFWTKRSSAALAAGVYSLLFGIRGLISARLPENISGSLFAVIIWLAPAIIFISLYFRKNKLNLLLPSMLFFGLALFTLLDSAFALDASVRGFTLFFLTMGGAFAGTYIIRRPDSKRTHLYIGAALILLGLYRLWRRL